MDSRRGYRIFCQLHRAGMTKSIPYPRLKPGAILCRPYGTFINAMSFVAFFPSFPRSSVGMHTPCGFCHNFTTEKSGVLFMDSRRQYRIFCQLFRAGMTKSMPYPRLKPGATVLPSLWDSMQPSFPRSRGCVAIVFRLNHTATKGVLTIFNHNI